MVSGVTTLVESVTTEQRVEVKIYVLALFVIITVVNFISMQPSIIGPVFASELIAFFFKQTTTTNQVQNLG